ncbi:MAG: hypothetical protein J6Y02_18020 [Pseudobutyrivibrio sp.]|nr:hypothetical protein [Pseudobutyrivibrio sp.]
MSDTILNMAREKLASMEKDAGQRADRKLIDFLNSIGKSTTLLKLKKLLSNAREHAPARLYRNPHNNTIEVASFTKQPAESKVTQYIRNKLKDEALNPESKKQLNNLLDRRLLYERGDNTQILEDLALNSARKRTGINNLLNRNSERALKDKTFFLGDNYFTPRELLSGSTSIGNDLELTRNRYNAIMAPEKLKNTDIQNISTEIVNSLNGDNINNYVTNMNKYTKHLKKNFNKRVDYSLATDEIANNGGIGKAVARGRVPDKYDESGRPVFSAFKNDKDGYGNTWGTMAKLPDAKINEYLLAASNGELNLDWFKENAKYLTSPDLVHYSGLFPVSVGYAGKKSFGRGSVINIGNIEKIENILRKYGMGLGGHKATAIPQFDELLEAGAKKIENMPLVEAMLKYNTLPKDRESMNKLKLAISGGYETKIPENLVPSLKSRDRVFYNVGEMPDATFEEILSDPFIQLRKWMSTQNNLPVNEKAFAVDPKDAHKTNLGGIISKLQELNNTPETKAIRDFSTYNIKKQYLNRAFDYKTTTDIPKEIKDKHINNYMELLESIQNKYNQGLPKLVDDRKHRWNSLLQHIKENDIERYNNSPYFRYFIDEAELPRLIRRY